MAIVFALILFASAGTLAWPAGWIYLVLFFGFTVAISMWLLHSDPDLLAERLGGIGKSDQKTWDKVLLAITGVCFFTWLAIIGLDAGRYNWSRMPLWVHGIGVFLLVSSFGLFYVTFRENTSLSPAVRIQKERKHSVVSTGPYHYVRHPMYAGFILFSFGTALMLGSWCGVLGALLLTGIVGRRAVLEERVLIEELHGYLEYSRRVRYRFAPHVW